MSVVRGYPVTDRRSAASAVADNIPGEGSAAGPVSARRLTQRATDELLARDESLAAATEELRQQRDALQRASLLIERERTKYWELFSAAPEAYVVTDLK